jgi:hypothetical protein
MNISASVPEMLAEEWLAIERSHSTMTYLDDKIRMVTVPENF